MIKNGYSIKILQIYVHFPPINQNILINYAGKKINSTPMNYSPIPRVFLRKS